MPSTSMDFQRTIFLDVGGHAGETLDEVLKPIWKFDKIISFEPHPEFHALLMNKYSSQVQSGRLEVVKAAFSNKDGTAKLYGGNRKGEASLFAEKDGVDSSECTQIKTLSASTYIRTQLEPTDLIVAKLNCEGGEVLIVEDLLQADCIDAVHFMMIDFDIRKVKGGKPRAKEMIRRLNASGFHRWILAETAMVGPSHQDRIRNWLSFTPALDSICQDPASVRSGRRRPSLLKRWKTALRYGLATDIPTHTS